MDQGVLCGKTNVSGFPALGLSPSGSPTGHQKIVWTRSHSAGRTHSGGWGGDWLFCRRIRRNRALALRGTQAVGSRARAATALVQSGRGIHAPVVQSSVGAGAPRAGAAKLRGRQVATFRTGHRSRPSYKPRMRGRSRWCEAGILPANLYVSHRPSASCSKPLARYLIFGLGLYVLTCTQKDSHAPSPKHLDVYIHRACMLKHTHVRMCTRAYVSMPV